MASSLASFEAAIRINPEYADAHLNLALCRLLTGDFKGGWPGYEWRWQQDPAGLRDFKQPLWQGDTPLHDAARPELLRVKRVLKFLPLLRRGIASRFEWYAHLFAVVHLARGWRWWASGGGR
jgi:hypothetical protein